MSQKKNSIKPYVSSQELMMYTENKIRKDLEFFKKTVPYVRFVLIGGTFLSIGLTMAFYKLDGRSNLKKLYLNILGMEENHSYNSETYN